MAQDGAILVLAKSTATGQGIPGFAQACSMVLFRVTLDWLTGGAQPSPAS